jgi:molybdate transport system substrate-binding protein
LRRRAVAAALALALGAGGCGGESQLKVSAASSLKRAFTSYGTAFHAQFSFAGSDELAAQIRAGVRPDVYAAANTRLPDALFAAKLVERPVVFASNRLVIAVPAKGAKVRSLGDLGRPGVTIAAGSASVPVGAYTLQVLARLPAAEARAIRSNFRSEEPDVAGVVGKVSQGAVDAGFVYATDVLASGGRLRAIELPARVKPVVDYAAAVVRGSDHRAEAERFVRGLRVGAGRRALRAAGFGPPAGP